MRKTLLHYSSLLLLNILLKLPYHFHKSSLISQRWILLRTINFLLKRNIFLCSTCAWYPHFPQFFFSNYFNLIDSGGMALGYWTEQRYNRDSGFLVVYKLMIVIQISFFCLFLKILCRRQRPKAFPKSTSGTREHWWRLWSEWHCVCENWRW